MPILNKKLLSVTFLVLVTLMSQAHEFWLQTARFRYKIGEEMKVDFVVGENFTGEFWDLNRHRVEKFEMHSGATARNLLKDIKSTAGKNLTYKFDKEGTHVLALESNAAYLEMEAGKFNEYLKEDGLDYILDERTQLKQLDRPSRELYKRFAKLMVQAGARTDEIHRKRMGFRYEILPLTNPYLLKSGDYLECRVLWEGKPSPHSLVKVWSHLGNRTFLQNIYTENDGTVKFPISSTGPWMVSAVKMIRSEKQDADYESFWASLVFGIEDK